MNHFAAEQIIVERLATIPELKKVGGWTELETLREQPTATPAACAIYLGENAQSNGRTTKSTQTWGVALVINAGRVINGADKSRIAAGPLISKIIETLQGAEIPGQTDLVFDGSIDTRYFPGFTAIFYIQFSTALALV